MRFTVTESASKDIRKLPKVARYRLKAKLVYWQQTPKPLMFAKPPTHYVEATHRFRLGAYRIIVKAVGKNELRILRVRHRKEVYRG